jgi:hypothetical protein
MFKEMNASAGRPAGRGVTNQPVTVGSGTSVRSAAMNDPKPLSPQEVAERDARARQLGLLPAEEGDGPYGSLAAAQAAAGDLPVVSEKDDELQMTAREMIALQGARTQFGDPIPAAPAHLPIVRLPDFRKVSGFDFHRNVLYIDGLEFSIPEEDVRDMKRYAVDLALNHVVAQLAAALVEFGVPQVLADQMSQAVREGAKNGAGEPTTEAVQEVRESGHPSVATGEAELPLPGVPETP